MAKFQRNLHQYCEAIASVNQSLGERDSIEIEFNSIGQAYLLGKSGQIDGIKIGKRRYLDGNTVSAHPDDIKVLEGDKWVPFTYEKMTIEEAGIELFNALTFEKLERKSAKAYNQMKKVIDDNRKK
jgi:hypothetical protein